jgi:hypothetical protein
MALLRRAPREVYRVFSETDFLEEAHAGELFDPVPTDAGRRLPLHRIAGVATLVGAVVAVGAMLIMHGPPAQTVRRSLAPTAAGAAEPAGGNRAGSGAASTWGGSHELPRTVSVRRRQVAAATRSGPFAASGPPQVEPSHAVEGTSPQAEQAEFGFER